MTSSSGIAKIVVLVPNLFFSTRIAETAARLGIELATSTLAGALDSCRSSATSQVILDLEQPGEIEETIRALKNDPDTRSIRILAFYAHVHNALRESALVAGADLVLPRSAFAARLPQLLAGEGGTRP
jgi:CheY-like chemotaxis protein